MHNGSRAFFTLAPTSFVFDELATVAIHAQFRQRRLARSLLNGCRMQPTECVYEVDRKGLIVYVDDEFCRALRCSRTGLIGRDVRELLRPDFRIDFRLYVARALVGMGSREIVAPMVAPCGEEGWFKHAIEPLTVDGSVGGYRATLVPPPVRTKARRWWQLPSADPRQVWNFETVVKAG